LTAAGLIDQYSEPVELRRHVRRIQPIEPCGKNGGLDHRVLGAVEAKKVSQPAVIDHVGHDPRAFVAFIERSQAKGVPSTGIGEDYAIDGFR
jgi:hypothetical protein